VVKHENENVIIKGYVFYMNFPLPIPEIALFESNRLDSIKADLSIKVTNNYSDLYNKFENFRKSDSLKYKQVIIKGI
jgi:hypothetical protein